MQSQLYILNGIWQWDMLSDAIYCSDVMSFPQEFEGTKGLVHPDDQAKLRSVLKLLGDSEPLDLQFRIITTYGQVQEVKGKAVDMAETLPHDAVFSTSKDLWKNDTEIISIRKEAERLQLRREMADLTEKLYGMGVWYLNKSNGKAWYSDNVFRIYGLLPQSLNAHAYTFNEFIHPDDRIVVEDAFDTAYSKGAPLHIEYRIVLFDGQVKYVRQITHWTFNSKGHHLFSGILHDISEEKIREAELAAVSETVKLNDEIINFIESEHHIGHWHINLLTRKAVYSANYNHICGFRQPFQPGKNALLNIVHPEDKDHVTKLLETLYREHRLPDATFRIIRPDGKLRYLSQSGKLVVHNNETLLQAVVKDITEQKALEHKLETLQHKLLQQNSIYNMAEAAVGLCSVVWKVDGSMYWSEGFYKLWGYKPGMVEPMQRYLFKNVHHEDVAEFKDVIHGVLNGQEDNKHPFRIVSKRGIRHLNISFTHFQYDDKEAVLGLITEETEIKKLQEELEIKSSFSALIGCAVSDMVFLTDLNHTIIHWNTRSTDITGIDEEDALHKNLFDVFPILQDEQYLSGLHTAIEGNVYHNTKARNTYIKKPHQYTLTPYRNAAGGIIGVLHVVKDIAREQDLKQQLSQRLNFIESLIEASVDRIVVLDRNMNYLYWNHKAEEYYGINRHQVLGKNILEVFPGFRNDPSYQEFRRVLRGETVYLPASTSIEGNSYFETYLIPVKAEDEDTNAVLWVVHDLSNEMELQAERASAIETLQREHQLLKEAQAIGHLGNFEWHVPENVIVWSDELYNIYGLDKTSEKPTLDIVIQATLEDETVALKDKIEALRSTPGHHHLEHKIRRRDGSIRHLSLNIDSKSNEQGIVTLVRGTVHDITDIVAAYLKIAENEALLQASEAVSRSGSYEYNLQTGSIRFSDGMFRLFGETPQSFVPTLSFIDNRSYPDDVPYVSRVLQEAAENKQPYTYKRRIYHKDGSMRTVEAFGRVITNSEGKALKLLGMVQDITDRLQTEAAIKEAQAFTEKVLDTLPDFVMVFSYVTNKLEFVSQNQYNGNTDRYAETLALTYDSIINRAHPDDRAGLHHYIQSFKNTSDDAIKTFEFRQIINGQTQWFRDRGRVFKRNEKGEVTHLITIVQNITNDLLMKQQLLDRTLFLETLFDTSIDRILIFDKDLRILSWNKRCEDQIGIPKQEVMGKHLLEALPKLKADVIVMDAVQRALEGEKVYVPYKQSNYTGEYAESHYIPVRDEHNEVVAVLLMARDVSQRVQDEKELQTLKQSLKKKKLELKEKAEEISRFAFVASHDLKEPLRKIHFFSDVLLTTESAHLSAHGIESLHKLEAAVKKLDRLIADILVLTQVNADNQVAERVDLQALLAEVLEAKKDFIHQKHATIQAAPLPIIKGNKNHIVYLFKNLLSNALKFQPEGNKPTIIISAATVSGKDIKHPKTDKEKTYLQLFFKDNGIGFDKKFEESIFKMFQKLHSQQHYSGTGIGLAICKKVMDNHNGFITASSEVGKGAQFNCYFPLE